MKREALFAWEKYISCGFRMQHIVQQKRESRKEDYYALIKKEDEKRILRFYSMWINMKIFMNNVTGWKVTSIVPSKWCKNNWIPFQEIDYVYALVPELLIMSFRDFVRMQNVESLFERHKQGKDCHTGFTRNGFKMTA